MRLLQAITVLALATGVATSAAARGTAAGVPDGAGGMFAAITMNHARYYDLYLQHVNAAGSLLWPTNGSPIARSMQYERKPVLIADGTGGAFVAWEDARGGNSLYLQRVNSSGVPQWTAGGVLISGTVHSNALPHLLADGAGGVFVAWRDVRSDPGADLYTQRVSASGVVLWDPGGNMVCDLAGTQTAPGMVSDGAGGIINVWTDSRSGNADVYAMRQDASGTLMWGAGGVALVNLLGEQFNKKLIADGANGVIVAWQDQRNGTTNNDVYAQRMNNSGTNLWTANGVAMCTATGDQLWPALVSDGSGGAIATWRDRRGGVGLDLYAQRLNSSGTPMWTANGVAMCTAAGDQTEQVAVPDGLGGTIVAWPDARSGQVRAYCQRLNASGSALWTADGVGVGALGFGPGHSEVALAGDGAGGAIVSWYDALWGDRENYAQRLNALGSPQWTAAGVELFHDPGKQRYPAVTADGGGGSVMAWSEKEGEAYAVYARSIDNATGAWKAPRVVLSGSGIMPVMCPGAGGNVIVAWVDGRSGLGADVYAQTITPSGAALWPAGGVAVCTAAMNQFPVGISPATDGAIVVWADARSGGSDIYAQRVTAAGTAAWAADGVVVCNAAGDQQLGSEMRYTVVAPDGSGGAIVVWQDKRSGAGSDLYAQRVNGSGVAQWASNGVPVCTAVGDQRNAVLVADGGGGVVIAWEDLRAGPSDIYAQHLTGLGSPLWTVNGMPVEPSVDSCFEPRLVSDGAGSAIIVWRDYWPPSYDGDIHAQRLNAAVGTPLWTAGGVPVCTASGKQYDPRITADGFGGAIVAWADQRSGTGSDHPDLYAQRLDASGNPSWMTDGVAVCDAPDSQVDPSLAGDGAGGAVIAWTDRRDGVNDYLYSARVGAGGLGLWVAHDVVGVPEPKPLGAALELAPPQPNPTAGPLEVLLSLPDDRLARVELLDVAGRVVLSRSLEGFGAGRHSIRLAPGRALSPGIYLLRAHQGDRSAARRVCVFR